jgi:hypothetical protein
MRIATSRPEADVTFELTPDEEVAWTHVGRQKRRGPSPRLSVGKILKKGLSFIILRRGLFEFTAVASLLPRSERPLFQLSAQGERILALLVSFDPTC